MGVKKGTHGPMHDASRDTPLDFLKYPKIGKFGEMVLRKTDPHYKSSTNLMIFHLSLI